MPTALDIVRHWHAALNAGDIDGITSLVAADVEVGGPRGSSRGLEVVREWFGRANVHMIPLRFFARGSTAVVEQRGEWLSPDHSEITSAQIVATLFVTENNLITKIIRYPDAKSALAVASLTASDQVL